MTDTTADIPEKLGRYEVVRILGKGAMGVVYEGKDPNIGRRVAIKTARRDVMESSGRADEMMERFLREARAAGSINHPNIITIYDAAEQDGLAYIAMEYIEGTDLQKQLQAKKRFSVSDVIQIGSIICEALAHAHSKGIVHRDVKPSNIMVLDDGTLRVADFGIAHVTDSNLTQEGAMIGTPHYMSPEQFMGQKVDGRSDLFSVGIILYEMLTGEKPFPGEAISTVMHSVIKTNPIDPKELNFSVNPILSQVIIKSLAKDPSQRYQSGAEMAAALCECLKENPNPAITKLGSSTATDATVAMSAEQTMLLDIPDEDDPDATKLAGQPKDMLAADTQLGGPQPGAGRAARDGAAAKAERDTTSTGSATSKRPLPVLIGGAIVLLVVIGAAVAALGGNPAVTYSIPIHVKLADTGEQYAIEQGRDASEFHVVVTPKGDPDTVLHEDDYLGATTPIQFKTNHDEVTVIISADGYESTTFDVNLTSGRIKLDTVVLTTREVLKEMNDSMATANES